MECSFHVTICFFSFLVYIRNSVYQINKALLQSLCASTAYWNIVLSLQWKTLSLHNLMESNLSTPSVCSHHKVQANNQVQSVALHHSSGMDMARFTDYGLFTHFFVVFCL